MSSRKQNERKFESWSKTEAGGRIYLRSVDGKHGWRATYCKEVNAEEETIRFWQEIFDSNNILRETHTKFPVDTGHQKA